MQAGTASVEDYVKIQEQCAEWAHTDTTDYEVNTEEEWAELPKRVALEKIEAMIQEKERIKKILVDQHGYKLKDKSDGESQELVKGTSDEELPGSSDEQLSSSEEKRQIAQFEQEERDRQMLKEPY